MAIPTDVEPRPRTSGVRLVPTMDLTNLVPLSGAIANPAVGFIQVLSRRRSLVGGPVPDDRIGSLLWHATSLRERGFDGRFGQWESRTAPSAGGLHPIRLMVLPMELGTASGIYDDARYALGTCGTEAATALALNRSSVGELTCAEAGTTIQLFADPTRIAACYENHASLLWRDAGAQIAILCLAAEALDLTSVPLGRHGTDIVRAFGLDAPFVGLGAVHVGSSRQVSDA